MDQARFALVIVQVIVYSNQVLSATVKCTVNCGVSNSGPGAGLSSGGLMSAPIIGAPSDAIGPNGPPLSAIETAGPPYKVGGVPKGPSGSTKSRRPSSLPPHIQACLEGKGKNCGKYARLNTEANRRRFLSMNNRSRKQKDKSNKFSFKDSKQAKASQYSVSPSELQQTGGSKTIVDSINAIASSLINDLDKGGKSRDENSRKSSKSGKQESFSIKSKPEFEKSSFSVSGNTLKTDTDRDKKSMFEKIMDNVDSLSSGRSSSRSSSSRSSSRSTSGRSSSGSTSGQASSLSSSGQSSSISGSGGLSSLTALGQDSSRSSSGRSSSRSTSGRSSSRSTSGQASSLSSSGQSLSGSGGLSSLLTALGQDSSRSSSGRSSSRSTSGRSSLRSTSGQVSSLSTSGQSSSISGSGGLSSLAALGQDLSRSSSGRSSSQTSSGRSSSQTSSGRSSSQTSGGRSSGGSSISVGGGRRGSSSSVRYFGRDDGNLRSRSGGSSTSINQRLNSLRSNGINAGASAVVGATFQVGSSETIAANIGGSRTNAGGISGTGLSGGPNAGFGSVSGSQLSGGSRSSQISRTNVNTGGISGTGLSGGPNAGIGSVSGTQLSGGSMSSQISSTNLNAGGISGTGLSGGSNTGIGSVSGTQLSGGSLSSQISSTNVNGGRFLGTGGSSGAGSGQGNIGSGIYSDVNNAFVSGASTGINNVQGSGLNLQSGQGGDLGGAMTSALATGQGMAQGASSGAGSFQSVGTQNSASDSSQSSSGFGHVTFYEPSSSGASSSIDRHNEDGSRGLNQDDSKGKTQDIKIEIEIQNLKQDRNDNSTNEDGSRGLNQDDSQGKTQDRDSSNDNQRTSVSVKSGGGADSSHAANSASIQGIYSSGSFSGTGSVDGGTGSIGNVQRGSSINARANAANRLANVHLQQTNAGQQGNSFGNAGGSIGGVGNGITRSSFVSSRNLQGTSINEGAAQLSSGFGGGRGTSPAYANPEVIQATAKLAIVGDRKVLISKVPRAKVEGTGGKGSFLLKFPNLVIQSMLTETIASPSELFGMNMGGSGASGDSDILVVAMLPHGSTLNSDIFKTSSSTSGWSQGSASTSLSGFAQGAAASSVSGLAQGSASASGYDLSQGSASASGYDLSQGSASAAGYDLSQGSASASGYDLSQGSASASGYDLSQGSASASGYDLSQGSASTSVSDLSQASAPASLSDLSQGLASASVYDLSQGSASSAVSDLTAGSASTSVSDLTQGSSTSVSDLSQGSSSSSSSDLSLGSVSSSVSDLSQGSASSSVSDLSQQTGSGSIGSAVSDSKVSVEKSKDDGKLKVKITAKNVNDSVVSRIKDNLDRIQKDDISIDTSKDDGKLKIKIKADASTDLSTSDVTSSYGTSSGIDTSATSKSGTVQSSQGAVNVASAVTGTSQSDLSAIDVASAGTGTSQSDLSALDVASAVSGTSQSDLSAFDVASTGTETSQSINVGAGDLLSTGYDTSIASQSLHASTSDVSVPSVRESVSAPVETIKTSITALSPDTTVSKSGVSTGGRHTKVSIDKSKDDEKVKYKIKTESVQGGQTTKKEIKITVDKGDGLSLSDSSLNLNKGLASDISSLQTQGLRGLQQSSVTSQVQSGQTDTRTRKTKRVRKIGQLEEDGDSWKTNQQVSTSTGVSSSRASDQKISEAIQALKALQDSQARQNLLEAKTSIKATLPDTKFKLPSDGGTLNVLTQKLAKSIKGASTTSKQTTLTSTAVDVAGAAKQAPNLEALCLIYLGAFIDSIGYAPYPGKCHKLVQCFYLGGKLKAVVRDCPAGMFWDQSMLLCRPPDDVLCFEDRCLVPGVTHYRRNGGCSCFFKCTEGISVPSCCPKGYKYDDDNECVLATGKDICDDECETPDILARHLRQTSCPSLPDPMNKYGYLTPEYGGLRIRACPAGTLYSEAQCRCKTSGLNNGGLRKQYRQCSAEFKVNFDDGFRDISKGGLAFDHSHIFLRKGKALFRGNSKMYIWGFQSRYLGKTFAIRFRIKVDRGAGKFKPEPIISNCGPNGDSSVEIMIYRGKMIFKAKTEDSPDVLVSTEPYDDEKWLDVTYYYDGNYFGGSCNGKTFRQRSGGNLAVSDNPMAIGLCSGKQGFHGEIDELEIFTACIPKDL